MDKLEFAVSGLEREKLVNARNSLKSRTVMLERRVDEGTYLGKTAKALAEIQNNRILLHWVNRVLDTLKDATL